MVPLAACEEPFGCCRLSLERPRLSPALHATTTCVVVDTMNLNSDSDSDSGTEEPTCARSATINKSPIMNTPVGGIDRANLAVGTRLLIQWESGWESGAVGEKVTAAMGGRSVDGTATTLYRIDYDDGESCLHDLESVTVKLEASAAAAENGEASDDNGDNFLTWAQCERCDKWRKLSNGRALPEHWFCELNPNRAFASCHIAEEQWSNGNENQEMEAVCEVVGRVVDDNEEVEVEAVWEIVEETSFQTELDPSTLSVHKKPGGRPPKGTDGLPMRWSGPKEAGRWVEKGENKTSKQRGQREYALLRGNVRTPLCAYPRPFARSQPGTSLEAVPYLAWQCTRILRRGFAVSSNEGSSIEQIRLMLYSELHALIVLAREHQVLPAHWQATTGALKSMIYTAKVDEGAALVSQPPLLLPQPELFAAMVSVRDELAMVRSGGQCQHTDLDERTPTAEDGPQPQPQPGPQPVHPHSILTLNSPSPSRSPSSLTSTFTLIRTRWRSGRRPSRGGGIPISSSANSRCSEAQPVWLHCRRCAAPAPRRRRNGRRATLCRLRATRRSKPTAGHSRRQRPSSTSRSRGAPLRWRRRLPPPPS